MAAHVAVDHRKELARYEAKRKRFRSTLFCVFFTPILALTQLISPFFCTFMSQLTRVIWWGDSALNFVLAALFLRWHLQENGGLWGPTPPVEEKMPALEPGEHV